MPEQTSFRDVAHQEFHNNGQFVHCLIETGRRCRRGCTPNGLLEIGMRRTVI